NFTIEISDGNGGTTTVTVNITVAAVNDAPTGTGDTQTTLEDTPVNGAVSGSDTDGDALTFAKSSDPTNGAVVVNPDGTYTYTPNANYHGPDNFTIEISDGNGGTITVTVNITVTTVNDAPTGAGDTQTTPEDIPISGAVSGSDVDGDVLTFTKSADPANGTVVVNPDGTYTYTPNADYHGPDNFTIEISDGNGGTTTVTINITVTPVNDAPTGTGDTQTTNEDTPVSGSVSGSDVDGDALTFIKSTDPINGTAVVNADGTYTYIPNANYHGPDSFTIEISDGQGGTTSVTVMVTVTPVNDAPTGTGDDRTTNEGTPVSGAVTGADIDGDALTFTKATDPIYGIVTVNPDGTYTYTPNAGYTGTDHFTIEVNDGHGGTITVSVTITVLPVTANAGITLVKLALLRSDKTSITYIFNVTNTGNVPLHNVTITDPMLGLNRTLTAVLQPGELATETVLYQLTQEDRERGSVSNTATASGQTPVNTTVTDISGTAANNDTPTETAVPAAPRAHNDEAETRMNTPVTIPVLANDDALHSEFNPATVTIITMPVRGQATINEDGTVTYIPANGYTGDDHFSYQVQDEDGYLTNIAMVTLNVVVGDIKIPTLFTPNGDGKNDVFEIRGLDRYPENELIVINRWGNEVFRQQHYQNNWKGDGLNEGTYYYLLRIRKTSGSGWEVFKGYTTIIRKFKQ
ncbi:Ig-like domain-containing protein, partial [Chitinophaga japonensis]